MDTAGARRGAYVDLLTGLLDLRQDSATERFDELIDAAVHAGRLDDSLARELRYWQREAQRSLADHLIFAAAGSLDAVDAARRTDTEAVRHAAEVLAPHAQGPDAAPTSALAVDEMSPQPSADVEEDTPNPAAERHGETATAEVPTGRHRATALDAGLVANVDPVPPAAARRRRLLVAGLTVIGNDDLVQDPAQPSTSTNTSAM